MNKIIEDLPKNDNVIQNIRQPQTFLYFLHKRKLKKIEDKETGSLVHLKNISEELKTDDKSVLFTEEKISDGLFKRLKKSQYCKL